MKENLLAYLKRSSLFMKENLLAYLKRSGLFFLAFPLAHWAGVFVSGVLSVIAAFAFKENYSLYSSVIEYACLCTTPFISLFFLVQYFTGYDENDHFSPKTIIASIIPLFVLQWIYLFIWGPAFWINGICANLSFICFSKYYNISIWPNVLIQLGLQLLVYLPIYVFASRNGYLRKAKEDQYSE